MKKTTLFIVLLVAALAVLSACAPKVAETVVTEPTASVPQGFIAEGSLLPVNELIHSFAIPGQVAEVLVQDGESVTSGQVLARLNTALEAHTALVRAQQEALLAQQALDALDLTAEVNLAEARLAFLNAQEQLDTAQARLDASATDENQAQVDLATALLKLAEEKLTRLEDGNGIDPDLLAAARARQATAEAVLVSAQAAVDSAELKASMDGVLVDLKLTVGQRVTAGQPVLTVADFTGWVVKTDNLTEVEVVNVAVGQQVMVTFDALPEQKLEGEVVHINQRFEEKRGDVTYTVTIALKQADAKLRWGMTSVVQFVP